MVSQRGFRLGSIESLHSARQNAWWNTVIISPFSVFALLILLFALVFFGIAVKSVAQGYERTVERFGRYVRTLEPGLALLIPIFERIGVR